MALDFIRTPFYKTRLDLRPTSHHDRYPASACTRLPQRNYKAYQLFALKTRLQPLVDKRFAHIGGLIVNYQSKMIDDKIMVIIKLYDGEDYFNIESNDHQYLQDAVNYITGNDPDVSLLIADDSQLLYTSINMLDSEKQLIPNCWMQNIIKHLSFSAHLRPHHRQKTRFETAGIYVDLSRTLDYQEFFDNTYLSAIGRIRDMYGYGYFSLPTAYDIDALAKWGVVPIGLNIEIYKEDIGDETRPVLFRANWYDLRLTQPVGGMVPFLQKHLIGGSNKVLIEVGGTDVLTRHRIAKRFQGYFSVRDYMFKDKMVEVKVNNLKEARRAASLVKRAKTLPVGKVISIHFQKSEQFNLFLYLFPENNNPEKSGLVGVDMLGYVTDDQRNKYCLSVQVPYYANMNHYYKMLNRWYREQTIAEVGIPLIRTAPPTRPVIPAKPSLVIPPIKPFIKPPLIKIPPITIPSLVSPTKPYIKPPKLFIKPPLVPSIFPFPKEGRISLAPAGPSPAIQPPLASTLTGLIGVPVTVA